MLTVSVYNDGPQLPSDWDQSTGGIGLSNVRTRLESFYGDGFALSVENEGRGVKVSLSVPYREG
jgi:LytS/YehU family sensor histidine kinase